MSKRSAVDRLQTITRTRSTHAPYVVRACAYCAGGHFLVIRDAPGQVARCAFTTQADAEEECKRLNG